MKSKVSKLEFEQVSPSYDSISSVVDVVLTGVGVPHIAGEIWGRSIGRPFSARG